MTAALASQIIQYIESHGPITFAEFMQRALYTPRQGYYMRPQLPFGESGDFITAPEISPLLARCLANRYLTVHNQVSDAVLEVGAGSGALAVAFLTYLAERDALPSRYVFLEVSSYLAAQQKASIEKLLPNFVERCEWLSAWPTEKFSGMVIANELFDAMPVHMIEMQEVLKERYVAVEDGKLSWQLGEPSELLKQQWQSYDIHGLPAGYTTEVSLLIAPWIKAFSESVGCVHCAFIDYGYKREVYYHPERTMGTALCHYRHQTNDAFFERIGEQDITAHVDFTLVLESALAAGFKLNQFQTQAQFMMANGLVDLLAVAEDDVDYAVLVQQAKQLMLPGQMGEAFKVLEICHGVPSRDLV